MDEARIQAAIDAQETRDPIRYSVGRELASALGDAETSARALGRLHKLERADGWHCWECGQLIEEFHVSLHCEWCREQARQRRKEREAVEASRTNEDRLWEGWARAIATDHRLDRHGALGMLSRARERPSFTQQRINLLNAAFDKRFESQNPNSSWNTYAAASAKTADLWDDFEDGGRG